MTGINASTGRDSTFSTSSSRLNVESRYSSSPTTSRPSTSPARGAGGHDAQALKLVVWFFGKRRHVQELELFANLPPLQVGGDHRVFTFSSEDWHTRVCKVL